MNFWMFSKLMIQNNFAQDCNRDEVCTNATQNEKISMFPKFDDIPIFTNIKITTSKGGEGSGSIWCY